ncbi:Ser-Thr-rich glycosyl-phosphatidyl-inositol-anchored membrane family-domain-containing protein [Hypoxylon trugodes]|uniref:Ser-Thr-rich glycosyl-phosphatidyl-inositol-anchored membrane family-domain-containing protein n=1 Tax=Hypoxylon trugodes TaxID=326681 RepID=UPI0021A136E4|nr:Ser-Thr-rich glycosyl-phosphatidyl-inositol-anchored membrane family-domain-containing protein [Hypoxylon trugodes]KAI1390281.1 Ser-Thr-rich glycosyl-phosphatidyl-inositol-anchored membrane family-domain-containing protein [Hypoxylon trugodes]
MKSLSLVAILAALPAWVSAVLITNSNFEGITAGKPFEITWSDAAGPVTLTLKDGPAGNLETVGEITSGQTGESYTWVPSASLPSGTTYALEISDGTDVNYSKQFSVEGGSASSSASSSATKTSTSSAVSSTTASSTTTTSSSASSTSSSSSESSSATSSGSSTSSSTHASSTSSASKTSSASTSQTAPPNTNAAQTVVPFVAPMLLAVGAVFM